MITYSFSVIKDSPHRVVSDVIPHVVTKETKVQDEQLTQATELSSYVNT